MDSFTIIVILIIGQVVSLFIAAYIFRSVFDVKYFYKQAQLQTNNIRIMRVVISRLAEQQGIPKEELEKIYDETSEWNPVN